MPTNTDNNTLIIRGKTLEINSMITDPPQIKMEVGVGTLSPRDALDAWLANESVTVKWKGKESKYYIGSVNLDRASSDDDCPIIMTIDLDYNQAIPV